MRARLVAWTAVALTSVCVLLDTVFTALHAPLLSEDTWAHHGWPLATLATLGCSVMGALVVTRHPRHPIGWLLLAAGLASVSLATEAYSLWVLKDGGAGPEYLGHLAGWVSVLVNAPMALCALTLLVLIAPDGHLASPRWRWAARASVVGLGSYTASVLTVRPSTFELDSDAELGPITSLLTLVGIILVASALLASAVSLVLRMRRATGETRRQLLWIVAAAAALAFGFVFLLAVGTLQSEQTFLAATPLFAAYLAFPVCVAVAVLRHRLLDIDLIVNRALLLTIGSVLVGASYVVVVSLTGSAIGRSAGFWPSLLATAVVAMAFQPLRSWVVRLADGLAYGAAATPYEALADFSRRLGESPDPSRLLPAVAEAAGTAVGARRVTVRLPVAGAPDEVGTWPPEAPGGPARVDVAATAGTGAPAGGMVELPVRDLGETLGTVTVEMRAGRDLRGRDTVLLSDLADQAGVAFRNARLSAELAHQVDQLARRTLQLAESRGRLISAADAERRRLERSIARDVVPHLEPLPGRLRTLGRAGVDAVDTRTVQPLVAATTAALEVLRETTRGVFPAQLARSGLEAALASLLARSRSGRLVVAGAGVRRLGPRVEAAAYFCVAEAVRELDPPVEVTLDDDGERLRLAIRGRDLGHLSVDHARDRVEAVGGTLVRRTVAGATVLDVSVPAGATAAAPATTA